MIQAKLLSHYYHDLEAQRIEEHNANYARYLAAPKCEHVSKEIRRQTTEAGQQRVYWQCVDCNTYQQISRANIPEGMAYADLQEVNRFRRISEQRARYWEEEERITDKYRQLVEERLRQEQAMDAEANYFYRDYIQSDEWFAKRERVLARDGHVCQGCLKKPATQVHHLTYEHLGAEFMWELVSVCAPCHERLHAS